MHKILLLAIALFFTKTLSAQTLYAILLVQDDPKVGTTKDTQTMQRLLNSIDQNVTKLNLQIQIIDAVEASEAYIYQVINQLPIQADDVLWFYYTGHGSNYDTWPQTGQTGLSMSLINNWLIQSGARLTLSIFDSCNFRDPITPAPNSGWIKTPPRFPYYKELFLYSKGNIKIASCSSKQFSYGSETSGSFFTNAFKDALKCSSSWRAVLGESKSLTESLAATKNLIQNPQYDLSYGFIDGTYR